jgi:hypothetical protein
VNQECNADGVGSAQPGTAATGASRRAVLAGAGAAAVAMLSGCATYGPEDAGSGDTSGDTNPGGTSIDTASGDTAATPRRAHRRARAAGDPHR